MSTFSKSERLHRKKIIEQLFTKGGQSMLAHPVRMVWQDADLEDVVQVMFSAPKRNFKKAVDRNRIKRIMREAYRLNKSELRKCCEEKQKKIAVAFLFVGKEMPKGQEVRDKIIVLLQRLNKELETNSAE
ncbi:MAG TPA: ribonuclease P protein component [Flavobacteriales bacterium]|nr:ribonuclease P protein component [Flavobacteriales bacterium]HRE96179.1 ribonuclease P protein component [Flavobacteriales bacterium]HRJ35493.1 ribonuclease P protein component [Flavobacteriales bacterium]HRJ37488.1 ribonuclease P protein component [Flavobacteriales bacterium]